jgi:hypothetical protein
MPCSGKMLIFGSWLSGYRRQIGSFWAAGKHVRSAFVNHSLHPTQAVLNKPDERIVHIVTT